MKNKPCLKEINPEDHPGVYLGKPYEYDPNYGGCIDCPNKCTKPKLKRRENNCDQRTKEK